MQCVLIFGLFFLVYGIYMIAAKKGMKVFSKRNEEVTGGEAVTQGVIAIIVGLVIIGFWYLGYFHDRRGIGLKHQAGDPKPFKGITPIFLTWSYPIMSYAFSIFPSTLPRLI